MYNKFYGFSEKPFEVTLNPRFLFLTPSHREALVSMIDGIKNRRGFISITGEAGTGKTDLIFALLKSLNEKVKTVFIFHPTITFKELLEAILMGLGLRIVEESEPALLYQFATYLGQMDADEIIAIIIDEAQTLSEEVLRNLPMFSDLESKAVQMVLVGQPEFENRINSQGLRQMKQQIKIRCQIRRLTREESQNYIDHRLKLVGSSSSQVFTSKALSMICSHAQGIPRIINILCDNAFLKGYPLSQKRIDVDIIRRSIRDMESPFLRKPFLSTITPAFKKFRLFPPRQS